MRRKRHLLAHEFQAITPFLEGWTAQRIAQARRALVDGASLQSVADDFGCSPQAVFRAAAAAWKYHERQQLGQARAQQVATVLPPGWEQVTLVAPKSLIAQFRKMVAAAAAGTPAAAHGKRKAPPGSVRARR